MKSTELVYSIVRRLSRGKSAAFTAVLRRDVDAFLPLRGSP